jgi:hypothetical protein
MEGQSMGQGSTWACDSVYSVMNELDQIVSIHFVRAGDLGEIESILKCIKQRFRTHGFEEVKLFYTNNCCQEYDTLARVFETLAHNDEGFIEPSTPKPHLKLPSHWKAQAINTYDMFCGDALKLLTRLDSCTEGGKIVLGFDVEWDAITTEQKRNPHPALLQ